MTETEYFGENQPAEPRTGSVALLRRQRGADDLGWQVLMAAAEGSAWLPGAEFDPEEDCVDGQADLLLTALRGLREQMNYVIPVEEARQKLWRVTTMLPEPDPKKHEVYACNLSPAAEDLMAPYLKKVPHLWAPLGAISVSDHLGWSAIVPIGDKTYTLRSHNVPFVQALQINPNAPGAHA